ncbi:MAG: phage integrase N-terminal SAM-like domain-containing protein [Sandaracinaceae bacterium]|nr:phage integrase N-terminal SAM-like domain-containing protein [Sandaracinaceae bacterium]
MEQDLFLRGVAANTRETYLRYAKQFVAFHRRDPRALDTEEVRAWVMHLRRAGRAPRSINVALSALRFLFGVTLRRPEVMHSIRRVVEHDKQPAILSGSEVQRLLDAIERPRDRALVMLLYGSGLRISEALSLTTADVDSGRGVLTVRHTRGVVTASCRCRPSRSRRCESGCVCVATGARSVSRSQRSRVADARGGARPAAARGRARRSDQARLSAPAASQLCDALARGSARTSARCRCCRGTAPS